MGVLDVAKVHQKIDMCILFNLCSLKCSLNELETPCLHKYAVGTFKKRLFFVLNSIPNISI